MARNTSRVPSLLTPHARVLVELARDNNVRLRDLAARVNATERTAHRLVSDLVDAGLVIRTRAGRRASYALAALAGLDDSDALRELAARSTAASTPSRVAELEDRLRAEEERFRSVVEHLPVAVYIENPAGYAHVYVSPQIEEITGYTAAEWIANEHLWSDTIHPHDRARVRAHGEAAADTHTTFEAEYRLIRRDGRVIWIHDRCVPHLDEEGNVTMWLGVLVDASARRDAEDELRRAEEFQRIMFDNTSDIVTLIDRDGHHLYASPSTLAVIGYHPDDLVERTLGILHPDDAETAARALELALQGQSTVARIRVAHRRGNWVTLEASHVGIQSADGEPMVLVVARDTTERAALEERLRQADKLAAVGQLAGGIAHDFNNVLTTIIGVAELLLAGEGRPADWRESLEEIRTASERAASLTRQLLAFSRRQLLRPRIVDLNEPVRASERMLRRLIGEDIELEVVLADELRPVLVDPSQIDQVLVNLVVNARQAMPSGGRLEVSTEMVEIDEDAAARRGVGVGSYVRLTVTDTGEGMDATTLSHLFEPFFTTRTDGSGLGLATVYGIVEQSGGHTDVRSAVGEGTAISVTLPAVEGEPESGERTPATPARGTETLLLVEDEDAVRRLTRRALEGHGYTVLEAESPERALELAETYPGSIEMVVSDVVMPHMNGRDLVQELRRLRPDAHVLFVSGYDEGAVLGTDRLPDDVSFLAKPFTPSALHRKVREAIDA